MRPLRNQPRNEDEYMEELVDAAVHHVGTFGLRSLPLLPPLMVALVGAAALAVGVWSGYEVGWLYVVVTLGFWLPVLVGVAWWRDEMDQLRDLPFRFFEGVGQVMDRLSPGEEPSRLRALLPGPRRLDLALRCPYCHEDLHRGQGLVCAGCRAHAHPGCWVELDRCAACGGRELLGMPEGMRSLVRAELYEGHPARKPGRAQPARRGKAKTKS